MPEKKKNRKKKKHSRREYLIDYDLPRQSKCRREFYKKLDPELKNRKSTNSVILCDDLGKAKTVHKRAKNCGKSNLYRVKKLKTA